MSELSREDLYTLFELPFKKGNSDLITRLKYLIDSAYNKVDETGVGGGFQYVNDGAGGDIEIVVSSSAPTFTPGQKKIWIEI